MTLAPLWTTRPARPIANTSITYGDGGARVTVVGFPGTAFQVFGAIHSARDAAVSGTVQLTGP